MSKRIEAGLLQAATLVGVSLLTGALVAWAGLLLSEGQAPDLARISARFFPLLAILLPAVLVLYTWANQRYGQETELYQVRSDRAVMLLIASVGGSLGGALFYSLAAVYIPAIFGDLDPVAMQNAYFALLTPLQVIAVLATCLVTALLLTLLGSPSAAT